MAAIVSVFLTTSGMGSPYNSAENLSCKQSLHILCREEQGGPGNDKYQAANHGVAVSNAFRDPAVEKKTDKLSHIGSLQVAHSHVSTRSFAKARQTSRAVTVTHITEPSLPTRGDLPVAIGKLLAVLPVELRKGVEAAQEADVVAFLSFRNCQVSWGLFLVLFDRC